MHSDEKAFTRAVERVADDLVSLLSRRIHQVDLDSRTFARNPDTAPEHGQAAMIEATGAIDALRWTLARVEELRAQLGGC